MKRYHLTVIRLCWLSLSLLVLPSLALADTQTPPSPLGFAVGQANFDEVHTQLSRKAKVRNPGRNHYTRGKMFDVNGAPFGIRNLKTVRFIFNKDETLVATLMTLRQSGFNSTYNHLASKYTLVSKDIPFVGNKSARFREGDVVIVLDAPHMGFDMQLIYMGESFEKLYREKSQEDSKQEQSKERSNF